MITRFFAVCFAVLLLLLSPSITAQETMEGVDAPRVRTVTKVHPSALSKQVEASAAPACTTITPVTPPVIKSGTLSTTDCWDSVISSYRDVYSFYVQAGRLIVIDYKSTKFEVFGWLTGPDSSRGPEYTTISWLASGVSHERVTWLAPVSGTYYMEAEADVPASTGEYTLAFAVNTLPPSPLPNLTPYKPDGWSDKIVVSTQVGTNTDSAPLLTTDTLYLDFAVINAGVAAAGPYQVNLYVNGVLRGTGTKDTPTEPDWYRYWSDHSIGRLSAGTHTLRIVADSLLQVVESNEGDNEYTRTITVVAPSSPPPAGGSCTPNINSACLLNKRFKVQVRYRASFDNNPVDTQALAKSLTGFSDSNYDTGFFYFNSPNNAEVMVKMLDQGNRDAQGRPTIAVLYGSATPLRLEITITDMTFNGVTKVWTTEFNKQSGQTDFTAFIK